MTLTKDELLKAIETKSDQLNADDFIAGPRVFEIAGVSANATGDGTQPWNVRLAGQSRFYRPNKGFRRGLVKALGEDCASWVGKKIELYTDPSVTFGNEVTGGIKIGALSGIEDPVTIDLLVKRRRVKHTIRPLSEQDGAPGSPPRRQRRLVAGCRPRHQHPIESRKSRSVTQTARLERTARRCKAGALSSKNS